MGFKGKGEKLELIASSVVLSTAVLFWSLQFVRGWNTLFLLGYHLVSLI